MSRHRIRYLPGAQASNAGRPLSPANVSGTSDRFPDGVGGPCLRRLSAIGWPSLEQPLGQEPSTMQTITIGLDLAKNVFQVHGVDAAGQVTLRKKLRRSELLRFFQA